MSWDETLKKLQEEQKFNNLKRRVDNIETTMKNYKNTPVSAFTKMDKNIENPSTLLILYSRINNNLNNMNGDKDTLIKVREMIDKEVELLTTYAITIK